MSCVSLVLCQVSVALLAQQTEGFTGADLTHFVRQVSLCAAERVLLPVRSGESAPDHLEEQAQNALSSSSPSRSLSARVAQASAAGLVQARLLTTRLTLEDAARARQSVKASCSLAERRRYQAWAAARASTHTSHFVVGEHP
jgi:hypothetical protein